MKPRVVIIPYKPQWPWIFKEEKKEVLNTLEDKALVVEHIGSTSVPGLGAKDIVDMVVGVKDRQAAEDCRIMLESIDYTEVTPEPGHTEWFYCLGKTPGITPRFHLHLMKFPSPFFAKHILFRNYLRSNKKVRDEYYELKKRLADKYGRDREGYTGAKTEFIERIILIARERIL